MWHGIGGVLGVFLMIFDPILTHFGPILTLLRIRMAVPCNRFLRLFDYKIDFTLMGAFGMA